MSIENMISNWQATHQRTAAMDGFISDVRTITGSMSQELEAYRASVQTCLEVSQDDSVPAEDKLEAIIELLSYCHSGELITTTTESYTENYVL